MALAIIGGTGLEELAARIENRTEETIATPYGETALTRGVLGTTAVIFQARHGIDHGVAPHLINYRANMFALKQAGAFAIMAGAAVGSMRPDLKPGDMVLIDQFIDFTKNRASTFFDEGNEVKHTDMTEPYDDNLRRAILRASEKRAATVHRKGTYVCTEGPRFETPAEINMFRTLGGDVVGMTGVPEVVLANELGLPYASLCVVTNFAAGMAGHDLTYEECADEMAARMEDLVELFLAAAVIAGVA